MGMTIAEKIIAAAAGVDSVKPGDIHTVKLDRLMSNDGTTHLTVDMYNNKLKNPHIADTSKLVFIVDHNVPSDSPKTAASQKKMRDFAKEHNIDFWEGKGVCHQVMIENYVRPGELIFGADSHTCSYGALGAFGTGVGCTDFLYGMVTGTSWVLVPESVKFNLTGKLPEGVYARDLILTIIGEIGANGCNYQAMEFTGEGAKTLSISDRMALCNMAVEAGAKTGIFEADEKAIEYLKEHGREPKAVYHSLLGNNALFQLYKLQPFLSELFLVCLAALLLTLCTFLILTCFLFKLFASFLCVYLTDSLHKGLGLLLFAACFFVFVHLVDQLVDLRSLYRVTEQIIIIDQAVKEEHGKSDRDHTEDKTSQCLTWIFLSRTDVRVFCHNGKHDTDYSADQSHRSVLSAYKGKWQIKKAADNTCNTADQGAGCQLFR